MSEGDATPTVPAPVFEFGNYRVRDLNTDYGNIVSGNCEACGREISSPYAMLTVSGMSVAITHLCSRCGATNVLVIARLDNIQCPTR